MLNSPRLSVVAPVCNNNHGLHPFHRNALSLNSWGDQLRDGDELIIVDVGTDPSLPTLVEEIRPWLSPQVMKFLRLFKISKPACLEFAGDRDEEMRMPMLDGVARNFGIRQSKGDLILSTNTDMVVSPLYPCIGFHPLDDSLFCGSGFMLEPEIWRDIPWGDPSQVLKAYSYLKQPDPKEIKEKLKAKGWEEGIYKAGDFFLTHRKVFEDLRGFEEGLAFRWGHEDSNFIQKYKAKYKTPIRSVPNLFTVHLNHIDPTHPFFGVEHNDWKRWVLDFKETENSEDWGRIEAREVCLA